MQPYALTEKELHLQERNDKQVFYRKRRLQGGHKV